MAWQIQINRAKPNPTGKDKSGSYPIPQQLLGEWVDLKNIGDANVTLSMLHLSDTDFEPGCGAKQPTIYWNGSQYTTLKPGEIVRVHTGKSADVASMRSEDKSGVHYHAYAEKGNFVLNNTCGDTLAVWYKDKDGKWRQDDEASYSPKPPEGTVLYRAGASLVPAGATAGVAR